MQKAGHRRSQPEIMIPLVGFVTELEAPGEDRARRRPRRCSTEKGVKVAYLVGTMIELPRGARHRRPDRRGAEFFSFGTNDLTQTTLGMSRDDYGRFIRRTTPSSDIIRATIRSRRSTTTASARLMKIGRREGPRARGRSSRSASAASTAATRPASMFCHEIGLDYVSCSPFRVPIARLAAAQAALKG